MNVLLKIIKNKYFIVTVIFLVIVIFLDENNLFVMRRLNKEVKALHEEESQLKKNIEADSIYINNLVGSLDSLERYGREEYYMKRPDEDVFVVGSKEASTSNDS